MSDLYPDGDRLVDKLRPWTRGGSIFWLVIWTILYIVVLTVNGPKIDILVLFGLGEVAAVALVIRAWTRGGTRDAP